MISKRGRVAGESGGSQQPQNGDTDSDIHGWHTVPPAHTSGRQEWTEADFHPDKGSKTKRAPPPCPATGCWVQTGVLEQGGGGTAHRDTLWHPRLSPASQAAGGSHAQCARGSAEPPASCLRQAGGTGAGQDGQCHRACDPWNVTQAPTFPRWPPACALSLTSRSQAAPAFPSKGKWGQGHRREVDATITPRSGAAPAIPHCCLV